ncbi:MAG: DUF692 domain-containing protein [Oligoflexales bacterium]
MLVENSVGLGLRFQHFDEIISNTSQTPWFEVIADDFLSSGPHHEKLQKLSENHPIVMHSVGLNIGGTEEFDENILENFRSIYDTFNPLWISDHLCWSAHNGNYHHDLLPIPKTKDALRHICKRIKYLQDYFSRSICIENITSYINYKNEDFDEINFLNHIVQETNCRILLDVTNVVINHSNRGLDPNAYFERFPLEFVEQIHLAGGEADGGLIIDSHSQAVNKQDIDYLKSLIERGLKAPILLERDANIPDFEVLENERQFIEKALK